MAEAHESLPLLIPESVGQGSEARHQRDRLYSLEVRVCPMTVFQMVIRNARTQVMDVMKSNITGEPLQYFGELIVGATTQRRVGVVPVLATRPIRALKLVLHVEKPHAQRRGKCRHG